MRPGEIIAGVTFPSAKFHNSVVGLFIKKFYEEIDLRYLNSSFVDIFPLILNDSSNIASRRMQLFTCEISNRSANIAIGHRLVLL